MSLRRLGKIRIVAQHMATNTYRYTHTCYIDREQVSFVRDTMGMLRANMFTNRQRTPWWPTHCWPLRYLRIGSAPAHTQITNRHYHDSANALSIMNIDSSAAYTCCSILVWLLCRGKWIVSLQVCLIPTEVICRTIHSKRSFSKVESF